jgi:hypothetical protein
MPKTKYMQNIQVDDAERILAAAIKLAKAHQQYGKEYDDEVESLVRACIKAKVVKP